MVRGKIWSSSDLYGQNGTGRKVKSAMIGQSSRFLSITLAAAHDCSVSEKCYGLLVQCSDNFARFSRFIIIPHNKKSQKIRNRENLAKHVINCTISAAAHKIYDTKQPCAARVNGRERMVRSLIA